MITVAGGVYRENCVTPRWDEIFGSGGRAAVAISSLGAEVTLHAYLPTARLKQVNGYLQRSGVTFIPTDSQELVSFDYFHCLSTPRIHPPPEAIRQATPLRISGEVVLRFGFMEGDAIVSESDRVVYDPQSVSLPRHFRENGSTAKELVVIANAGEARLMTGETTTERALEALLKKESAAAVIVKSGPNGAELLTKDGVRQTIPAYRTESVFSIGSGDVFAASFAFFWGEKKKDIGAAADLASRSVAAYCRSRLVTLPEIASLSEFAPARFVPGRVYLAAPFFSISERWLVEEARRYLRGAGLEVFSPLHDVGFGDAATVAPADLAGLEKCNRVFALLDGCDPGTVFEVGFAMSKAIPVIGLSVDMGSDDLKMIEGTGAILFDDFVSAIYAVAWHGKT